MKIGIVIPVINLWEEYTRNCIDSIKTKHDYQIILINNASTDGTAEKAFKYRATRNDRLHIKNNDEKWSCAKSWNWGIKNSWENGSDLTLVLNNDIVLHPKCLDVLAARFDLISPGLVMATCHNIRKGFSKPEDMLKEDLRQYEKTDETEHPDFSGFMITKECWEKVGEFDEGFHPAYFEDNDYHYRIKLAGLKAINYPPALFYHFGSRTSREGDRTVVTNQAFDDNRSYFCNKWGGIPGEETFKTPFNDPQKDLRSVKQNEDKQG
jgi:GT2 family glycosyltransferase